MTERDKFSQSKIARIFTETYGFTIGDVLAHYDITLKDLFDYAAEVNWSRNSDKDKDALVALNRICVQDWIDYSYNKAPKVAERLDRELNSEDL